MSRAYVLALRGPGAEYGRRMAGTSISGVWRRPTARERSALRRRVGEFIQARRDELGLSQGDIMKRLGYRTRMSVSAVETGREGLPTKRVYAWADVLEVSHDEFFKFVTGEVDRMPPGGSRADAPNSERLTTVEKALVDAYRKLPAKFQRRLREQAVEFETLARTTRPRRKR